MLKTDRLFNRDKRHKQMVTALNEVIIKQVTPDQSREDLIGKMATDAELEKDFVEALLAGDHRDQFKQHAEAFAESLGVKAKDVLSISREDKKKYYTYVPWGVTSFAELDALVEAQEEAEKIYDLADQYTALFWNIVDKTDIEDKAEKIESLFAEFQTRLKNPPSTAEGSATSDKDAGADPDPASAPLVTDKSTNAPPNFMVWKDAKGEWHWLGIYSNAFEDRHDEILSSDSHRDFEKAFDSGDWPVVELWPWHLPLPVGYGTLVSYDPVTKMAIGAGKFVKGAEHIAEAWSKRNDLGMSHGMPFSEIQYSQQDHSVIDRYRSREFTVLPLIKAANLLTDFISYQEFTMPIPQDKKDFLLESGMTETQIATLESKMQQKAAAGDALGLRFKELLADEPSSPPPVTPSPTPDPTVTLAASAPTPPPAASDPTTKAAANPGTTPPPADFSLADLVDAVKEIGHRQQADITALRTEVAQLKADVGTSLLALSPQLSLTEILSKDIFGDDSPARVDGRTSLAKDGPAEHQAARQPQDGSLLSSAINYLMELQNPA